MDRYRIHQELEEAYHDQGYQWALRETDVLVRRDTKSPTFPDGGRLKLWSQIWVSRKVWNGLTLSRRKKVSVDIAERREAIEWLRKRLVGFEIKNVRCFRRWCTINPSRQKPFKAYYWTFDIEGHVVSAAEFNNLLKTGIGKGRPYGFGMICVERIKK